jgi:hypothetical protein
VNIKRTDIPAAPRKNTIISSIIYRALGLAGMGALHEPHRSHGEKRKKLFFIKFFNSSVV